MPTILKYWAQLVLPVILIVAACLAIARFFNTDVALPFAAIASGLISFVFCLSHTKSDSINSESLRISISTAVIIQYLVIVGLTAFFQVDRPIPKITETLLTNFTTVVGIIVAFFFGSSAYVQAHRQDVKESAEKDPKTTETPPKSQTYNP